MLEGTKNEKAIITLLSFVIGLTVGYIGFGTNQLAVSNEDDAFTYNTDYTDYSGDNPEVNALIYNDIDQDGYVPPTENPPNDEPNDEYVSYKNGYLTVNRDDGELVLSVNVTELGDTIPEALVKQGYHIAEPVYTVSPDKRFVYFCEQHLTSNVCSSYIYDNESVSLRAIKNDGQIFTPQTATAASAYWSNDGLHLGDYISESFLTPWKLVKRNQ